MSREQLFAAFFFAVFLILLYQLYLFLSAFFAPLLWAAVLALTFYPLTTSLARLFRGNRTLAAFALVLAVTVVAILPSFFLGSVVVRETTRAYRRVHLAVQQGELLQLIEQLRASRLGGLWSHVAPWFAQFNVDLSELVLRSSNWISDQIVGHATSLARNLLVSVAYFVFMLVALFFLFRDGDAMAARLRDLLPMEREHKDEVFARLYATLTAVVQSMVLTAATQGLLAGLGFWLIGGFSFSVLLAFLTALASLIPIAGAFLVWGSASLVLALTGHPAQAAGLALWSALFVSTADNWIKPLFIGGRARLPTFPLLISILGGLKVYGFLGVFLGPVVLTILLAFIDIYRELYREAALTRVVVAQEPRDRAASG